MDDELIELVHNMRFITKDEHFKLLQQIVDEIKLQNLSNDDIVKLLSEIDAEIVDDIIKMLEDENYLTKQDGQDIDVKLIKIYDEEFIKDYKSGVLQSRIQLKTNKNPRPISRFEILGVFFARTLNEKLLWGRETTDDEILNALIKVHNELCVVRKSNAIYEKQQKNIELTLSSILDKLEDAKNLNI